MSAVPSASRSNLEEFSDEAGSALQAATSRSRFHSQSPVGRLIAWSETLQAPELDFDFQDPLEGAGGFGASTAQFILAYHAYARVSGWPLDWQKVWKLYRELTAVREGVPPSGADLVAQWQGGVSLFGPAVDGSGVSCERLDSGFDWRNILIFSATSGSCSGFSGRKVATHHHLGRLGQGRSLVQLGERLSGSLFAGIEAVRKNDPQALGKAMNEYGDVLAQDGLEVPETSSDRRILGKMPGVLGVKGTGAMQSDALVVVMDPVAPSGSVLRNQLIQVAQARNLVLVADGLELQNGVV
jgi:hypothetical protein